MTLCSHLTEGGMDMVKHFLLSIANIKPDWSMKEVIDMQIKAIHDAVSGCMCHKQLFG